MNSAITYAMFTALVGLPVIAYIPNLTNALHILFRMSSAMIGTPWP